MLARKQHLLLQGLARQHYYLHTTLIPWGKCPAIHPLVALEKDI